MTVLQYLYSRWDQLQKRKLAIEVYERNTGKPFTKSEPDNKKAIADIEQDLRETNAAIVGVNEFFEREKHRPYCIYCEKTIQDGEKFAGILNVPGTFVQHWDFETDTGCTENMANIHPWTNQPAQKKQLGKKS